jgi:hypothetical protein
VAAFRRALSLLVVVLGVGREVAFYVALPHGFAVVGAAVLRIRAALLPGIPPLVPPLLHFFPVVGAAVLRIRAALLPSIPPLVPPLLHFFPVVGAAVLRCIFRALLLSNVRRSAAEIAMVMTVPESGRHRTCPSQQPWPLNASSALPGAIVIAVVVTAVEVVMWMFVHDVAAQASVEDQEHTVVVVPVPVRGRLMRVAMVDAARRGEREESEGEHREDPSAAKRREHNGLHPSGFEYFDVAPGAEIRWRETTAWREAGRVPHGRNFVRQGRSRAGVSFANARAARNRWGLLEKLRDGPG